MRIVLQRVKTGSVTVERKVVGSIDAGLVLLVGIAPDDNEAIFRWMVDKILRLRIFDGPGGFMDANLVDAGGSVLLVSQFTLYADINKGTRPSFSAAAPSEQARGLFAQFVALFNERLPGKVQTGIFGADMVVDIQNDGPVTLVLEKLKVEN